MNRKQIFIILAFGVGWFLARPKLQISEIAKNLENEAMLMSTGNTCGERNNNPGNIRPAGYTWVGQTGTAKCGVSGTFVVFSSPAYGIRAVAKDLLTKFSRGLNTVRKIITVYAPPNENDTEAYIRAVSKEMGVGADSALNMRDVRTITGFVYAIIRHENGRVIYSPSQIAEGITMALA